MESDDRETAYALRRRGLRRADLDAALGLVFRILCERVGSMALMAGATTGFGAGRATDACRTFAVGLSSVGLGMVCRRGRSGFSSDSS